MDTKGILRKKHSNTLLYRAEVYAIIGAAMEVHKQLRCGFLEAVYQEAFEYELAQRKIPFAAQKQLPVYYKKTLLTKFYIADIVAFDKIIVELKASQTLTPVDKAQVINYLKATCLEPGLLINFGAEKLEWNRLIHTTS